MRKLLLSVSFIFSFSLIVAQTAEDFKKMSDAKFIQEDYQYAMILIEKAIDVDKKNQWLHLSKADIQFALTGPQEAIAIVEKAISFDKKSSEPYNRMGSFYESAGLIDSAIIMYDMAIDRAKDDTIKYTYVLNRGAAKAAIMDYRGALMDYEEVLRFNPNDIGALNNIAPVLRRFGLVEESIACLNKIIAIDNSFIGPYINLGFIYANLDSLKLAIEYFDEAIKIDPKEPLAYSNRGHTYYKQSNYINALDDINKSISLYPTNSYAYRNLALVYIAMKNMNEACEALDYADYYGFTQRYGEEVDDLRKEHCKRKR